MQPSIKNPYSLTEVVPNSETVQVKYIKDEIQNGSLKIDHEYQRESGAWKKQQKSKLIMSIFEGYPLGEIIRNEKIELDEVGYNVPAYYLVDGQQRCTTLIEYMDNEFALTDEDSKRLINLCYVYFQNNRDGNKYISKLMEKYDKGEPVVIKYKSLPTPLQNRINSYKINLRTITNRDQSWIEEYFVRVQEGEKLKAHDLIHPVKNELTNLTKQLSRNEKVLCLFDMKFENGELKKDATRVLNTCFLELIGLATASINMGVPKEIKPWLDRLTASELTEAELETFKIVDDFFNDIESNNENLKVAKTEIKLILAFIIFGYPLAKNLKDFDLNKFARYIFNVAITSKNVKNFNEKPTKRSETELYDALVQTDLKEIYDNNIEAFRNLALLRKGSHNKAEVETTVYSIMNLYTN
jgi:uncharacterized protein with ParB-like and HNH nuclease domain